jgi:ATP-dependent RNA helicase RhlB
MLFSATLSYRVLELAYEHMNNPTKVTIESEQITAKAIREVGYMVANDEKVNLLIGLMRKVGEARSIVFVNTKRQAENVWGFLEGNGFKSAILSGDVPQKKRERLLKEFAANELSVLVATDVAARGLHIDGVSHVYNYDLPDDREDYVHRIGRTARAGAEGDAISFVCETYAFSLPDIEDYIGHKIPMEPVTGELIAEIDPGSKVKMERKPRPPRNNNRSGGKGGNGQKRRHHNKPRGDKPAA